MADEFNEYGGRKSVVLEGMYKGVAGKIEEVRESVSKELQFNSAQQASAYEAISEGIRQGMESVLAELRYLSQQNSAIYDFDRDQHDAMRDAVLEAVNRRADETVAYLETRLNEKIAQLKRELFAALRTPAEALPEEPEDVQVPAAEEAQETPAPARVRIPSDETFDYETLAEKIATVIPEPDYDLIADKVAAAVPSVDADAVADKVVAAIPPVDADAVADRVAESVPMIDYDLVAERVENALLGEFDVSVDEAGVDAVAKAVAAEFDYEKLAVRVAELLAERGTLVPAAAQEKEGELAAAETRSAKERPARVKKTATVVVPPADSNLTTRYKRSFTAKIIESDPEIKEYYFAVKNALLSYEKVNSQINWSNDRFALARETVAKVGVRGKTLCLYLALNPDDFPESVYHQKAAGDTKMYEKTPMMVKIKSGVALKRALRLVEVLMERYSAEKETRKPVDYGKQFAPRSEEQLLKEGLIKTALVEKSDLDF